MINVFNSNYEEIGSLNKNLALHTLGKVKIRYGRKYIDLLNDKGELNISIPKILLEKDSLENITKDGFYLVDGNLYAYYKGNIYQLTGVEGDYISFTITQNLTLEQIDIALNNIGLKYKNIYNAHLSINKGIVFIDDRIYYIDGNTEKELTLREPLSSINNENLGNPVNDNTVIIYKDGKWLYDIIPTFDDINKFPEYSAKKEKNRKVTSIFDPIQYSKVYTIQEAEFSSDEEINLLNTYNYTNLKLSSLKTIPEFELNENDIAILSFYAYKANNKELINLLYRINVDTETVTTIEGEQQILFKKKLDVITFHFKLKNNTLLFCDKNGNLNSSHPIIGNGYIEINNEKQDVNFIEYNNKLYIINNLDLEEKHLYIKAENSNKEKFKIDYKNALIALEENTINQTTGLANIVPHTVLGDLDDVDKYYKDPSVSFRTYSEKTSKQGLYSDLPVFTGAEFRGTWPVELTNSELVLNFPRYSKKLNTDLCTNHSASTIDINNANDLWRLVIPTIEWIKRNGAVLNSPLKNINETNLQQSPTPLLVLDITPYDFLDTDSIPIAIVYKNGSWTYEPVVPFSWFITYVNNGLQQGGDDTVKAPVISGITPFTTYTTVTITCATENAIIYYTTDGTNPTNSSLLYKNPISLNNSATIKAIAYKSGKNSSVTSEIFTKLELEEEIGCYYGYYNDSLDYIKILNYNDGENPDNDTYEVNYSNIPTLLKESGIPLNTLNSNSNYSIEITGTGVAKAGPLGIKITANTNTDYSSNIIVKYNNQTIVTWKIIIHKTPDLYVRLYRYPNNANMDKELISINGETNFDISNIPIEATDVKNCYRFSESFALGDVSEMEYRYFLGFSDVIGTWLSPLLWPYTSVSVKDIVSLGGWIYTKNKDLSRRNNPPGAAKYIGDIDNINNINNIEDLSLYAKDNILNIFAIWKPEFYTLTINPNYPNSESYKINVVGGTKISDYVENFRLNIDIVPEREGYVFNHWSESQNGDDVLSNDFTFTGNKVLYARWVERTDI